MRCQNSVLCMQQWLVSRDRRFHIVYINTCAKDSFFVQHIR